MFTPDLQAFIFKTSWVGGGGRKAFFGKETAALRLLMHLNPEQKMKSLWAGAKQYNDFPLISGSSSWTAFPTWSKSHIPRALFCSHFTPILYPYQVSVPAEFSQINKRKADLIGAVIYYLYYGSGPGFTVADTGLHACRARGHIFFFWLCFWA